MVKAGETVRGDDFMQLRHLQARVPDRFHHGIVLPTGTTTMPFGEQSFAAPINSLWNTP